jgi:hypothetical protein
MTIDNLIVITGGAYADVKRALEQWINLYAEDLQDDFVFKIFKNGYWKHVILADERLDNNLFYYLINYLNDPEGISYEIDLEGFTTGKEDNILKGKKILVYISSTDRDGDNVFAATSEGENFKVDFGGKIIKTNESKVYNMPIDLTFESEEILQVNKNEFKEIQKKEKWFNVNYRFKAISIITTFFFLLTCFILFVLQNWDGFINSMIILSFGIWGWFFGDYKMLREDKLYLKCLRIAVLYGIYGLILTNQYGGVALIFLGIMPLNYLILQKPTRLAYLKLFKREPEITRIGKFTILTCMGMKLIKREPGITRTEKFADLIYTGILLLGSIFFPILLVDIYRKFNQ